MQLAVRWHLWKALLSPSVWQLPTRRRGRFADEGAAEGAAEGVAAGAGEQEPVAAVQEAALHNNYLLRHTPRLAELLADTPQLLAPENVQLLADVQVRCGAVGATWTPEPTNSTPKQRCCMAVHSGLHCLGVLAECTCCVTGALGVDAFLAAPLACDGCAAASCAGPTNAC